MNINDLKDNQHKAMQFILDEFRKLEFPTTREILLHVWPDSKPNEKGVYNNSKATAVIERLRTKGYLDSKGGYKSRNNKPAFPTKGEELAFLMSGYSEKEVKSAIAIYESEKF